MSKFKIGTEVTIKSDGGSYSTYESFFEDNNLNEFKQDFICGSSIDIGETYTVLAKGNHTNGYKILVLGNSIGQVYLMSNDYNDIEEVNY